MLRDRPDKPEPSNTSAGRRLLPCALLALFAAQSLWFVATQSLTYDEPAHIVAGSEAWRLGRFQRWNDHPPLGRLWLTLPIAATPIHDEVRFTDRNFLFTRLQPGPEWLARRTRPMNTLLGLVLGLTIWFAARRIFSEGAANVALGLFAFTPSLIAHYSVATTDGMGALFIFLTAFQLVRWLGNRSAAQTTLMGLALGGLLLSKFYALPLVLLALGLMLTVPQQWQRNAAFNWKPTLAALFIALFLLWVGYFFHVSHLDVGSGHVLATFPNRAAREWPSTTTLRFRGLIPAGEFIEGFREVARSNHTGRPAWFLGRLYPHGGILAYYPVAILLKWPTALVILCLLSISLGLRKASHAPSDLIVMCLFPLLFFAFALNSHFDIGERHILPLYPFALMIAGGIWESGRSSRIGKVVIVLFLCVNAVDALRYAPDYLGYFSILVRPQTAWQLLSDSNLDWGQGVIALRKYQQQHPDVPLQLAYFGSVDPALYGVRATTLAPHEQSAGVVAIGATLLTGQTLDDPDGFHWLWPYTPQRSVDHCLWLYQVK